MANRVLLEAGAASGREPTANVELSSYLGHFLQEKGITLGTEDESSFPMRLLHFRRTLVEKMFAVHIAPNLFLLSPLHQVSWVCVSLRSAKTGQPATRNVWPAASRDWRKVGSPLRRLVECERDRTAAGLLVCGLLGFPDSNLFRMALRALEAVVSVPHLA